MCKLVDILLLCNDSMNVNVYNNEFEMIANYDGRDSIPADLNHNFVEWIYPVNDNVLNIGLV